MHPALSSLVENARNHHHLVVPFLLVLSWVLSSVYGPVQHQLLATSLSCTLICILAVFRVGLGAVGEGNNRATSWLAGGLLALSLICDRAACDREGIWSTKVHEMISVHSQKKDCE